MAGTVLSGSSGIVTQELEAFGWAKPTRLRQALSRTMGDGYAAARSVFRLARGAELWAPFPLRHRLTSWVHGFSAQNAAMYERTSRDFARGDRSAFLTDYARRYRCAGLNPERSHLDKKLVLRALLMTRGIAQPETVALIASGYAQLHPLSADARYVDGRELENWLIADGGRFVLKPNDGCRGRDVFLLEVRDGTLVCRRGRESRPFRPADCGPVSLIERFVEQGTFWRELCPFSANTMRVITMWTPGDAAPFLAWASQRIGTVDTAPTDNWSGGGVGAAIDLASGRLGLGHLHPLKYPRAQSTCTHHPSSGIRIEGAVIPHWDRVRETVLRAAASLPLNRYVGWDVLVDTRGTPVIIEGNANTDIGGLQVHGGLLADRRIRRFYERCGVI